jgi:YidC/Oxa1 family membrane protein insertase
MNQPEMDNAIVQQISTTRPARRRWWLLIAALALGAVLVAGCGGFGGSQPLSSGDLKVIADQMIALEKLTTKDALDSEVRRLKTAADGTQDKTAKARDLFLSGYALEVNEARQEFPDFSTAVGRYTDASKVGVMAYANLAYYRIGMLGAREKLGSREASFHQAKENLKRLVNDRTPLLVRLIPTDGGTLPAIAGEKGVATFSEKLPAKLTGPTLTSLEGATAVQDELGRVYSTGGGLDQSYYQVVDVIVKVFNTFSPQYGIVLALIFLALLVKLITLPLTNASFRGMRDMQRVQPLLKELQERYKDDQAKLAEAQMALYKEHHVNPMGGCLPMLIQLPIFIVVYQAVLVYAAGFATAHFLWIGNLAAPDRPLLVLYAASMVVTQLLTATPTTDPQQKAIQTQMTVMMPLMLFIMLQTVASAFILYWFFLNVFSSIHQYYMKWKFAQEDAAAAPLELAPAPTPKKGKRT